MDTVDLFIQNGYIVQNDDWFRLDKLPERLTNHKSFDQWLQNRRNSIQSLSSICRSKIRRCLNMCICGRTIVKMIKHLPLPSLLIDYLMFKTRLYNISNKIHCQISQEVICIDET